MDIDLTGNNRVLPSDTTDALRDKARIFTEFLDDEVRS